MQLVCHIPKDRDRPRINNACTRIFFLKSYAVYRKTFYLHELLQGEKHAKEEFETGRLCTSLVCFRSAN